MGEGGWHKEVLIYSWRRDSGFGVGCVCVFVLVCAEGVG